MKTEHEANAALAAGAADAQARAAAMAKAVREHAKTCEQLAIARRILAQRKAA